MSRASALARLARLAVLGLLASACEDPREPFDLDAIVAPNGACVTVVHEQLELDGPLHRFISDAPGSAGGWALTTIVNDDNLQVLAIVRVPASATEAPTPSVQLGSFTADPDHVEMRAGALPGEAWVLSHAGNAAILRRLAPELGVAASNGMLGNFPIQDPSDSCPTQYSRSLLLSDGRPYLLAIPDCSPNPGLSIGLLELERDTLEFGTSWALTFDPCAQVDPTACALVFSYWLPLIGAGGSAPLPDTSRVPIGFTQLRVFAAPPIPNAPPGQEMAPLSDVALLDMRLTASGPTARLVTLRSLWVHTVPVSLGPVTVTQDPYSIQLHVRNELLEDDALLLRLDTIDDVSIPLRDPLPFDGKGELVQLADQGVMLDVEDGVLRGVPLIDPGGWSLWTTHDIIALPDLIDFEVAGVGQLLLRREQAPPQVVHVACLE
ncbi:hypothetical protein [Enhygromyxa salina]|uniref:Lipoprotein n=1 Tax=Enhygromyxa salina TaxID=215803 RepID=A0A2S9YRC5_9BACT|nr:hypothetical protein [Enhygromyxa salina]PRQ07630.1 hypothetical protein ENSA7_26200 [Enhygromyxa salina]